MLCLTNKGHKAFNLRVVVIGTKYLCQILLLKMCSQKPVLLWTQIVSHMGVRSFKWNKHFILVSVGLTLKRTQRCGHDINTLLHIIADRDLTINVLCKKIKYTKLFKINLHSFKLFASYNSVVSYISINYAFKLFLVNFVWHNQPFNMRMFITNKLIPLLCT